MVKKVYPLEMYARIWDSLRNRYNINPSDFKSEEELLNFLKSRNDKLAKSLSKLDFWNITNFLYRVVSRRGNKVYRRTHNRWTKDMERRLLELKNLPVKKIRDILNKEFGVSFTAKAISVKKWRLSKRR